MPPSIIQLQRELEDFPDERLVQEAQQPTEYPAFLTTQELKRRASLREKYQARQAQVPQGTVAERQVQEAMQNLAPMGPMAGAQPPGMPPQGGPPQGMPPQGGPPPMAMGGIVGLQNGGTPDWWLPKPGDFGEYEDFLAQQQEIEEALRWREQDYPGEKYEEYAEAMGPYGQYDDLFNQFEPTRSYEDWRESKTRGSFAPSPFSMEALSGWNPAQRELRGIGSLEEFDFVRENAPRYGLAKARELWQQHHGDEAPSRLEQEREEWHAPMPYPGSAPQLPDSLRVNASVQDAIDMAEAENESRIQGYLTEPPVRDTPTDPMAAHRAGFDELRGLHEDQLTAIKAEEDRLRTPTDERSAFETFIGGLADKYEGRIKSMIAGFGSTGRGGFAKAFQEAGGTDAVWQERDRQKAQREKYEDAATELRAKRHEMQATRSEKSTFKEANEAKSAFMGHLSDYIGRGMARDAAIDAAFQQVLAARAQYAEPGNVDALVEALRLAATEVDPRTGEPILSSQQYADKIRQLMGFVDEDLSSQGLVPQELKYTQPRVPQRASGGVVPRYGLEQAPEARLF